MNAVIPLELRPDDQARYIAIREAKEAAYRQRTPASVPRSVAVVNELELFGNLSCEDQ